MIEEAYCSFEVSKLLKEKGFDEKVSTYYLVHSNDFPEFFDKKDEFPDPEDVWLKCPTHQMAMAWLREVKIDIAIYPYGNYSSENYQFDVYKNRHLIVSKDDGYVTYEQAVEEALKYVLENLI